jgi:hypothetical protein
MTTMQLKEIKISMIAHHVPPGNQTLGSWTSISSERLQTSSREAIHKQLDEMFDELIDETDKQWKELA